MAGHRSSRWRASAKWPSGSSMPWRHASVDDRQRYLQQQAELGGAEVVRSRKATELVTRAKPADVGPPDRPAARPPVTVKEVPQLQNTGQMPSAKKRIGEPPSEAHRPAQLEVTG